MMPEFQVPPEGVTFRIIGNVSGRALYSRFTGDPVFGGVLASSGPCKDQYWSLVKGTGSKEGLFLFKNTVSGKVLYSRAKASPYVWHVDGGGRYFDNWFELVPGTGENSGMVRLVAPSTDTVLVSRANTDEVANYLCTGYQVYNDQWFKFEWEKVEQVEMTIERVDFDLDQGKIISSTPRQLSTQTLANNTNTEAELHFFMTAAQDQTSSFEYTGGSPSVGATIKGGIPARFEDEFRVDTSIRPQWTYGKSETFKMTYSAKFPIEAASHSNVLVVTTVNVGELEVPYTLHLKSKTGTTAQKRGIWHGVSSWDLRHSITHVVGLDRPSVTGNIISQNGSKFVATFIIDELQYIYSGNMNPTPGEFSVTEATLRYTSKQQLTGTHWYTGQVGISKVTLNIGNGPVASGPLPDDGRIDPASTVSGTGTWSVG